MKKSAFTMLELVFVIVVAGILAAVFIPRFDRDNAGEAAYQIARHVRLAQHHALVEDRIDPTNTTAWQKTLWRITFVDGSEGDCYKVFADRDGNTNADANETAVDPLTRKKLYAGSTCAEGSSVPDEILLWKSFGVSSVTLSGGCGGGTKNIAFDHLGRPGQISGGTMNLLNADCNISLQTNDNHNAEITVYQDTGFVKVTKIDGIVL